MRRPLVCPLCAVLLAVCARGGAMETIVYHDRLPALAAGGPTSINGPERTATGRVLRESPGQGVVLETDEGGLLLLVGEQIVSRSEDDRPFAPVSPEEMGRRLLAELPAGFRVHTTDHYVIAYSTSREFAEWTSSLMEGLYRALVAYWKKQGFPLQEPAFPLPIVVHESEAAYQAASRAELGGGAVGAIGYYSIVTNRVRMYDLTGSELLRSAAAGGDARRGSRREIAQMLRSRDAETLVATVVHEATHQVSYNTGMMRRGADLPIWYVEGMAVYFEAPEAASSRGWRGIGKVNRKRYETFLQNLVDWSPGSLRAMLADDAQMRDPRTAPYAYADAWALTYYLLKRRPNDYIVYARRMSEKKPFEGPDEADASARRLEEFVAAFGPIDKLETEFLATMRRL